MTKERRLGRGLEALLGQIPGWGTGPGPEPGAGPASPVSAPLPTLHPSAASLVAPAPAAAATADPARARVEGDSPIFVDTKIGTVPAEEPATQTPQGRLTVAIEQIQRNPNQPRQDFDPDEIQRLADSIVAHGLLQPVVVRQVQDGYQVVAGERRLRAAKQAGWTEVPVHVIEADDRQSAELAMIENLQRKDLNALEKAASFLRYLEQYACTQEELASRLKLDRSTIANLIRLLELPSPVQDALRRGKITQGHARALLPLGEEREQIAFCERIQKDGLSVRQTEGFVQETISAADQGPLRVVGTDGEKTRPRRGQSEHVAALEQEFRTALGLRVKITHDARGHGKVVIPFVSHEEFERLRQQICEPGRPVAKVHRG